MSETVTLGDELATRARGEAERSYAGDVHALVSTALRRHLDVEDAVRRVAASSGDGATHEARLANALATMGAVSIGDIEAAGVTLANAAGIASELRRKAPAYPLVRELLGWIQAAPNSRVLGCAYTSAQGPGGQQREHTGIVSYAEGWLRATDTTISGRLRQFFSDRRTGTAANPFDPARHDDLGIQITLEPATESVSIVLIAHSWQDARSVLSNIHVQDGVIVASGPSAGNQTASALYAISLATAIAPG